MKAISQADTNDDVGAPKSLKDFAAGRAKPNGWSCRICALPEAVRSQIDSAHEEGVSYGTICDWLNEEWHIESATRHTLGRHVRERHAARSAS